jgi:DUF1009 family protein
MKPERLGLIAGNGPLPLEVVREACSQGIPVTVAAIREETDPAIEEEVARAAAGSSVHWMGVGQLGRLIKAFKRAQVESVLMVGQVKHVRIFAPGSRSPFEQLKQLPDLRMVRLLASLRKRDTGSLIRGIIDELAGEGMQIIDSTLFLQELLAGEGVLTSRGPDDVESRDLSYGREVAREIARLDVGQTIVVKDQAVVAVEAMEGTDATIRRAADVVKGERLTVVKASRPNREMRYDVPVVGDRTLSVLSECNVSALGLDAGKTLIMDKPAFLSRAAGLNLTIVGFSE